MKRVTLFFLALIGGLFIYVSFDLPRVGDHQSPPAVHVSPRYIESAYEETGTRNMVSAVLADYRSFDTLGEVLVIVIAGLAIVSILSARGPHCPLDDH
ncbi:MAG: hydrogen gas-evolving membrane-bound hydrogenase subunit E [Bacillota bacterium]